MSGSQRLRDRVAIVTGASQGLGQHLALGLAAEGARVVLAARNHARLAAIAADIEHAGGTALAVPADVAREGDCESVVSATLATFGRIDILVLNAGFATFGKLEELATFAPIRDAMAINFFGAAYPTYLAIKHIRGRERSVNDHVLLSWGMTPGRVQVPGGPVARRPSPIPDEVHGIFDGRLKLARYFAAGSTEEELELYDLHDDPLEMRNLAADAGHAHVLREMADRLRCAERREMAPLAADVLAP